MESYAFVAIVMLKLDSNLRDRRERFVPDLVDEDDFWRCYFYECEQAKKDAGFHSKLGEARPEISEQAPKEVECT